METVIQTTDLTKQYESKIAVDRLNLTIRRGEVFGLLGPNGAGKTTTILMLLGLTEPTGGEVRVLGYDPVREPLKVKQRVGYLPDQVGFYDELTAYENLRYTATLNRIPRDDADERIKNALARMKLSDEAARRPVRTYSHGMRQRLGLAELLMRQSEIVILDEPTLGLDPEAGREFLTLIRGLKDDGITVMLSSHLLHQVQAICDRVGLFSGGKLALEGSVQALARQVLGSAFRIHVQANGAALAAKLAAINGVARVEQVGEAAYVLEAADDVRGEASRTVIESGGALLGLRVEEPGLDDVYSHYFKEMAYAT